MKTPVPPEGQITCQHCGHSWQRRTEHPRQCPACTRRLPKEKMTMTTTIQSSTYASSISSLGEVLNLLDKEEGMHSCMEPNIRTPVSRRRQEEASPWRGYRHRSGQARNFKSCSPRAWLMATPGRS